MTVKVVHSQTKAAWNIVGTQPGQRHKIARLPYQTDASDADWVKRERKEQYEMAVFLAEQINNRGHQARFSEDQLEHAEKD